MHKHTNTAGVECSTIQPFSWELLSDKSFLSTHYEAESGKLLPWHLAAVLIIYLPYITCFTACISDLPVFHSILKSEGSATSILNISNKVLFLKQILRNKY